MRMMNFHVPCLPLNNSNGVYVLPCSFDTYEGTGCPEKISVMVHWSTTGTCTTRLYLGLTEYQHIRNEPILMLAMCSMCIGACGLYCGFDGLLAHAIYNFHPWYTSFPRAFWIWIGHWESKAVGNRTIALWLYSKSLTDVFDFIHYTYRSMIHFLYYSSKIF